MVAYIDYEMVEEARFMRNTLECAVVELACHNAMVSEILQLEDNVRLQRFHLEHGNYGGIMTLDNQFHEMLFQIAQKSQVYAMIQHISIHFDRVRNMALSAVKDLKIVEDHANIVEALMNRDPALARATMEKHLNRYRFDEQAIREAYPQYFAQEA
jgi:DNA-binding GntR family transcriptional regulator